MSVSAHSLSFISKVGYIDFDIPSILSLSSLDGCGLNTFLNRNSSAGLRKKSYFVSIRESFIMSQGEQQKAKGNDEKESGMEVVSAPDLPGGGSSNVIDGGNGVDGVMEPMAIGTSNVADTAATEQQGGGWFCFHRGGSKDFLNPHQRLFVSPKAMKWSLSVLRFGVLASSVSATILQPNYPIMVLPGAHQVRIAEKKIRDECLSCHILTERLRRGQLRTDRQLDSTFIMPVLVLAFLPIRLPL